MHTLRARFAHDIIAEFLPPRRSSRKVVILLGGMPSVPAKKELLDFLSQRGYWAFSPRYRGSWESGGTFLKISPDRDVLDVISGISKGFKSIWDDKRYKVKPSAIYLIGSSFGGPAAILASRDPRVTKAVAFSPVVDWRVESKIEKIDWMKKFTKAAFGNGYHFRDKDWNKLKSGTFYNPAYYTDEIDGRKVFIIHAKDDNVVGWCPVKKFAGATGAKLLLLRRGGHLSASNLMKPVFYKKIKKFFSS